MYVKSCFCHLFSNASPLLSLDDIQSVSSQLLSNVYNWLKFLFSWVTLGHFGSLWVTLDYQFCPKNLFFFSFEIVCYSYPV